MNRDLGIISATYWEIHDFVRQLGMKKKDDSSYEYRDSSLKVLLQISGIGRKNATRSAQKIFPHFQNSTSLAIFSTGFACGLKKEMQPGDLVIDIEKSDPSISSKIIETAQKLGLPTYQGKFLTTDRPLMTAKEKEEVLKMTGAVAVEMESDAIFQFCSEKKVLFCSFRTISDTLNQDLPRSVLALDSKGNVNLSFWKKLLLRPAEFRTFFRLVSSSKRAEKNLSKILLNFLKKENKW